MVCIHLREGADWSYLGRMTEYCELDGEGSPDCDNCDHYEEAD